MTDEINSSNRLHGMAQHLMAASPKFPPAEAFRPR